MYRIRIGLIAAALILVATVSLFFWVSSDMKAAATRDANDKVLRAEKVYKDISQLRSLDLANFAAERGRKPEVVAVFDKTEETALRQAAFDECEKLNGALEREGRKADILAILNSNGKIIARNLDPEAGSGEDLRAKYPAVAQALKGIPVKDIWSWNLGGGKPGVHEVAIAPITRPEGTIVGAILVAWVVSAKTAQNNRDLLGTEIGYFHAGTVHTSSFVSSADPLKEDVEKTQALGNLLFGDLKLAAGALAGAVPPAGAPPVAPWVLEGRDYAVLAASMPGNFADKTSGFAVLAALPDGTSLIQSHGMKVILLGLFSVIVALVVASLTARRFIGPLDKIELGVAEIINTNIDYTFKPVGPDFEGLSNSLNVMLARLLGREEPNDEAVDEEEDEGTTDKRWKADLMSIDSTGGEASPAEVAALAEESEAAYYPRLFNEYVNALHALGQPSGGLSVQAFMAKLSLAEAGLREKWECKSVRFQIVNEGGEISFRAVKIA
jgi:hypothetical protein